ncbi:CPBP family intramembrane glutamic endopeptidase [Candidatus Uabimicrobium amorphum]|uniref:Abortive infection protein n=1 Tax=Uabimicrobium amorphum TaxID=2596890 RepID=A0A5S9IKV7_UABAM|nr:CPBP family intramembrane glutamic endopeptidase [Candidatus Uabimicrobium amorphum]BBM83231.1 abortive infection protein [Candidatus Uabimicrobium amorphum]
MEKQLIDLLKSPQAIAVFVGIIVAAVWAVSCVLRKIKSQPFEKASWDITDFFVAVCIFFVVLGIAQFFITQEMAGDKYILIVLNGLIQLCTCGFLCLWLRKFRNSSWSSLGIVKLPARKAGYAIAAYLLSWPIFVCIVILSYLLVTSMGETPQKQEIVIYFMNEQGRRLWIGAMVAIVFIPIFEEFFFRAFLYSLLRSFLGVPLAIVGSAICFAAVHGTLVGFLPIASLGVFFALLYERTQAIWIPIAVHSLHNLITILLIIQGIG